MRKETITIEVLGTDILNENQRYHWAKKAKHVKQLRAHGAIAARTHQPFKRKVWCQVLFTFPKNHRRDIHNYLPTVKAVLDGMVDSGLLVDDSHKFLVGPDLRLSDEGDPLLRGRIAALSKVRLDFTFQEVT